MHNPSRPPLFERLVIPRLDKYTEETGPTARRKALEFETLLYGLSGFAWAYEKFEEHADHLDSLIDKPLTEKASLVLDQRMRIAEMREKCLRCLDRSAEEYFEWCEPLPMA
jgi:hypothetical protein